jgi:ADP-ribose pyrophosphatase YjhB (NUDIX family)
MASKHISFDSYFVQSLDFLPLPAVFTSDPKQPLPKFLAWQDVKMHDDTVFSLPVPAVGVGAVVFNSDGQVLLIKRNQAPASGFWSIPGGKQEAGESLAQACCREVAEETGLAVQLAGIIAVVERRTEGFHYVIIDYLARPLAENNLVLITATDVDESLWVDVDNIEDYALVPGLAEIIRRASKLGFDGFAGGLLDIDGKASDYILPLANRSIASLV